MNTQTYSIHEELDTEGEPVTLTACPHDGNAAHIVKGNAGRPIFYVACSCGARGPICATVEAAIERWNVRV